MSKRFIMLAVLVVFAISLNGAVSATEYPPNLEKAIAPYPDAEIVQTVNVTGTVMVIMETNDKADKIFKFYKKELTDNGWKILTEIKQQGHNTLISEKGSNNIVVDIGEDQTGKSMISLTLAPK